MRFSLLSERLCEAAARAKQGKRSRLPEAGILLWTAFQRLSFTRTYNSFGPNPLQMTEIESFCRMMRLPLEPRQIDVILAMDRAWLEQAYVKSAAAPEGVKILPPQSDQALTPALLDLMFG